MTYEELMAVNAEIETVDIKGKQYATVNERLKAFRKMYPDGFIRTKLISDEDGKAVIQAEVGYYNLPTDREHIIGTGTAYEVQGSSFINKTSYIENCETSAVGRALGMAGFGIEGSIRSADEMLGAEEARGKDDAKLMTELLKVALRKGYTREDISKMAKVQELSDMDTDRLEKAIAYFELAPEKSRRETDGNL